MSEQELFKLLSVAKEAALCAGEFLLNNYPSVRKITKESAHDLKIDADNHSEKIIIDLLSKNSNFSILSEECGRIDRGVAGCTWIIDPVDGTTNYIQGVPISCISIGLWQNNTPFALVFTHSQRPASDRDRGLQ